MILECARVRSWSHSVGKWFWKTQWTCRKNYEITLGVVKWQFVHTLNIWPSDLAQWAPSVPGHFSRGYSKVQNLHLCPNLNILRQAKSAALPNHKYASELNYVPLFARTQNVKRQTTVKTIRLSPEFEPRTSEIRSTVLPTAWNRSANNYRQAPQLLHWLSYPG